jgi:predicted phosphodiesterase
VTRLAILADLHGNLPALRAVVADARAAGAEQIVLAGDVANYGPFSSEVLATITAERWPVIRGNGEMYLTDYGTPRADPRWTRPGPTTLASWCYTRTDPALRAMVAAWPDTLCLRYPDGPPVRVVHGSPRSAYEALSSQASDDEIAECIAGVEEETIVFAHIHEVVDRRVGRWRLINPGSAGVPEDGDTRAQYALLDARGDGWEPEFRRVAYDVGETIAAYERQGFVEEVGPMAEMVLRELRLAEPHIGPFLRWRHAEHPRRLATLADLEQLTDAVRARYTPPHKRVRPVER